MPLETGGELVQPLPGEGPAPRRRRGFRSSAHGVSAALPHQGHRDFCWDSLHLLDSNVSFVKCCRCEFSLLNQIVINNLCSKLQIENSNKKFPKK